MTKEQFTELYAMNLFSQDQTATLWAQASDPPPRKTWQAITKKERNKYRDLADDMIEEAGI